MKIFGLSLLLMLSACGSKSTNPGKSEKLKKVYFGTTRGLSVTPDNLNENGVVPNLLLGSAVVRADEDYQMQKFSNMSVEDVTLLEAARFKDEVKAGEGTTVQDVLVFIHGYNNTFVDAIKTAAQMQFDEQGYATSYIYSWPSAAATSKYHEDEVQATSNETAAAFRQFVDHVIENSQGKKIHLVAHSMGNRVLLEGLRSYVSEHAQLNPFTNVVFAAPDESTILLQQTLTSIFSNTITTKFTLYTNKNDRALQASKSIRESLTKTKDDRAGSVNPDEVSVMGSSDFTQFGPKKELIVKNIADSLFVVDASKLSRLGNSDHAYFRDHKLFALDLGEVLAGSSSSSRHLHRDVSCRKYFIIVDSATTEVSETSNDKRCAAN